MDRTTAGDHSDPGADLHRTREWLNYIFNATPVGIGLVLDQVIREVNPHLCQMLGYDADELLGQPVSKIFPGHEQADAISGHGMGNLETRLVRKDGKILDILLNSVPLDPANLSAGMTFTAMDITGQNWTEKALIDSEQRSRNLIDTSPWVSLYTGWMKQGN
jgi:PAS domain S-box-containing protein